MLYKLTVDAFDPNPEFAEWAKKRNQRTGYYSQEPVPPSEWINHRRMEVTLTQAEYDAMRMTVIESWTPSAEAKP